MLCQNELNVTVTLPMYCGNVTVHSNYNCVKNYVHGKPKQGNTKGLTIMKN